MGSKRRRNEQPDPIEVPIFIPTEDGQSGDIVLGRGEMRGSTLVLSFNDLLPAQAIAHRIERGGLVGLTFIIPAEENEQHKANEDAIQKRQDEARALAEAADIPLDEGLTDRDVRDLALLETVEPDNKD